MNDPLKIEQPGGLRNAVYGIIVAVMIQGIIFIGWGLNLTWTISQTEAHFESRLEGVEHQQTLSQQVIDKLNDAREEFRVHSTQVDGSLSDLKGKLSVVLEILQQPEATPEPGGTPNGGPENFQHPPTGKGH